MLTKPVSYKDRLRAAIEQGGRYYDDDAANLDGVVSLNSSMFDSSVSLGDMSSLTGVGSSELETNENTIVETEQVHTKEDELAAAERSSGLCSLLEAGTLIAGVVGIALILTTGSSKKGREKANKKEETSWLAKDW